MDVPAVRTERAVEAVRRHARPRRARSRPCTPGEVYGFLGPNGAGKTTTIRLLLGLHRPTVGPRSVFGVDAWRDPVAAHRRVAYVAGEPFLWPSLTGAETLAYPRAAARLDVDVGVPRRPRRALPARHGEAVRALSKGNRQKVQLDRGVRDARRPARSSTSRPRARPADGGRVPRDRARGEGARPDGVPLVAHPQRGRGALRPRRHPPPRAARRRGHARGAAPPERADDRGDVRRASAGAAARSTGVHVEPRRAEGAALRGDRQRRPLLAALAPHGSSRSRAASRRSRRSSSTTTTPPTVVSDAARAFARRTLADSRVRARSRSRCSSP